MNATEMMETFGNGGYDEDSCDHMIENLSKDHKSNNNHKKEPVNKTDTSAQGHEMTQKSLEECSLQDINTAIAKAITEITGTKVEANISQLSILDRDNFDAKNNFELKLSLKIDPNYSKGFGGF